ncbi:hypothetical protein ABID08_000682 [Rhizobium binae]|uniref:CopG family transcriptional regulator n=1 Tax=Rhizobium binae TaxID=1138190 RepID=A0ABV2MD80_9HYPH|nr:hypothetical protein [Rhizobium binae]NKL52846.1 hypothetical protein [Rhizobium leguminosarum bv. viciae]MBX4929032.1 hypothetical protein [Rhizobium binae]MBX4941877.1 hypothetical protein [Rhizobium binae]MBX4947892.1 hypothetical protein [Rhizobium binae]MBX4953565.1 hypothetical protein [Rhizobium binae]
MPLCQIPLDDCEITTVTDAVRQWCEERKVDIDSIEGRRAMTLAVDLIQTNPRHDQLLAELSKQMARQ